MKHSLLVAALLALAVSACGKKEDAAATPAAQVAAPVVAPAAASAPAVVPAAEGANASNATGAGLKLDNVQAPATPAEQK
ncbi:MAG TPA: hypothetical protein VFF03_03725 [Rhodocyclaceae bacterium]|nr:hypothetical protein [Rhodocyclaceae bacterium]